MKAVEVVDWRRRPTDRSWVKGVWGGCWLLDGLREAALRLRRSKWERKKLGRVEEKMTTLGVRFCGAGCVQRRKEWRSEISSAVRRLMGGLLMRTLVTLAVWMKERVPWVDGGGLMVSRPWRLAWRRCS